MTAYDAAYPNIPAELAKHPVIICAYTDGEFAYTAAQVAQIRAAGSAVLLNHERAVDQLLGGYSAGVQAATDAVEAALALGAPADGTVAICYSVDLSVDPSQFPVIASAFDGINTVHAGRFKASVYSEGALIDYLAANGKTQAKGWLSASSSFPGYNQGSPNVGMWQHVGSDVPGTDQNTVTDAAGLCPWWPDGYQSAVDAATLEEDDMPKPYLVSDPTGAYIVAADFSSRIRIPDPADVTAISNANQVIPLALSSQFLYTIPVPGDPESAIQSTVQANGTAIVAAIKEGKA